MRSTCSGVIVLIAGIGSSWMCQRNFTPSLAELTHPGIACKEPDHAGILHNIPASRARGGMSVVVACKPMSSIRCRSDDRDCDIAPVCRERKSGVSLKVDAENPTSAHGKPCQESHTTDSIASSLICDRCAILIERNIVAGFPSSAHSHARRKGLLPVQR